MRGQAWISAVVIGLPRITISKRRGLSGAEKLLNFLADITLRGNKFDIVGHATETDQDNNM